MKHSAKRKLVALGIIEGPDQQYLIALPKDQQDSQRQWQWPRVAARPGEPAEAAMRRLARENLGVDVTIHVGQPPVLEMIHNEPVELRCFFCDLKNGSPQPRAYAETRWVSKAHLREYEFENISKPIVEWILAG